MNDFITLITAKEARHNAQLLHDKENAEIRYVMEQIEKLSIQGLFEFDYYIEGITEMDKNIAENLKFLESLGFTVVRQEADMPYPHDGIVYKISW